MTPKQPPKPNFAKAINDLGLLKEDAVRILRANGVVEAYDPNHFDNYMDILRSHVKAMKEIDDKRKKTMTEVRKCEICGADVEYDSSVNNMFGVVYGWRCKAQGAGENHFIRARFNTLKDYFVVKGRTRDDIERELRVRGQETHIPGYLDEKSNDNKCANAGVL